MNTPHPDASLLRAIADGKQMQVEGLTSPWQDATPDHALFAVYNSEPCRIKPDFVVINGVECPKPESGESAHYAVTMTIPLLFQDHTVYFSKAVDALCAYQAIIKPFKEFHE